MSEKVIKKEELVKMIRSMVKENLQKRAEVKKVALQEQANSKKIRKISVKELQEMVRESIKEVLAEQASKKETK